MTVVLIIAVLVLIGLWKFGKFDTVATGIKNLWNSARSSTPPAPGTPPPPAPGTPAAQPLWKQWAWPVGIILALAFVILSFTRPELNHWWSARVADISSVATGDVTRVIDLTDLKPYQEISSPGVGVWEMQIGDKRNYTCKPPGWAGWWSLPISPQGRKIEPSNEALPFPNKTTGALVMHSSSMAGTSWTGAISGEGITVEEGDKVFFTVNAPSGCKLHQKVSGIVVRFIMTDKYR